MEPARVPGRRQDLQKHREKMTEKITIVDSGLSSDQVHQARSLVLSPELSERKIERQLTGLCVLLERADRRPTVARPVTAKGTERSHHTTRAAEPTRSSSRAPNARPPTRWANSAALGPIDRAAAGLLWELLTDRPLNGTSPCRWLRAPRSSAPLRRRLCRHQLERCRGPTPPGSVVTATPDPIESRPPRHHHPRSLDWTTRSNRHGLNAPESPLTTSASVRERHSCRPDHRCVRRESSPTSSVPGYMNADTLVQYSQAIGESTLNKLARPGSGARLAPPQRCRNRTRRTLGRYRS